VLKAAAEQHGGEAITSGWFEQELLELDEESGARGLRAQRGVEGRPPDLVAAQRS